MVRIPSINTVEKPVQDDWAPTYAAMPVDGVAEFRTAKLMLKGVSLFTILPCPTVKIKFPEDV